MMIRPLDCVTETEKAMMLRYINENAFDNESASCKVSMNYLLREWDAAKQDLFHIFGEKLILSKEIEFSRDTDELAHDMGDMLTNMGDEFYRAFDNYFFNRRDDYDYYSLTSLINTYCLATNTYDGVAMDIYLPSGKFLKLRPGDKVIRVLGKLAKAFDLPGFEEFRIAHSMVLNQKTLKGNLCFSIHPFDYMTMSDNNCNWSSCMSWMESGCYRRGTVEMMNSSMVIVAYLTSNTPFYPCGDWSNSVCWHDSKFTWNNKKWRQLFIVNEDIISNVKAYPYRNDELTKICLDWLKELVMASGSSANYTEQIVEYSAFGRSLIPELNKTIVISPHTYDMYNDFGDEQFAYIGKDCSEYFEFSYSGLNECMACGDIDVDFGEGEEGRLACNVCVDYRVCDNCGCRVFEDEEYEVDGVMMCENCVGDYAVLCTDDEYHLLENTTTIYLGKSADCVSYTRISFFYDDYDEMHKDFPIIHSFTNEYHNNKNVVYLNEIDPENVKKWFGDYYFNVAENDFYGSTFSLNKVNPFNTSYYETFNGVLHNA